ncbi:aminotransferase class V-fold PLP-dependent enzyme [Phormidium sp. CLA17]|uniref:aminotransferase class V-fold PLP-dependent enzyme n=1 Tax=Leptolyngbya sp. Cla-17 TaxID=2803751 RepID=UPI0014929133|nr:aminotransferase class V-fold PLP-dependent enzyme [Leptolyngbya sp. Cla-17]MBM0740572.1 aminotransferase class V-fold PLP-dependent enzyme [Leptolyngbya sp. Cla-17]
MAVNRQVINAQQSFARFWSLDPAIAFLNHGSFGACPIAVLDKQQHYRQQMERQPLQFLGVDIEPLLDEARSALAPFVGADAADLVFVPNATTGVNAVLRSLKFQPGGELLTTNHEYNACRNALDYIAEREGLKIVVAEIPFPLTSSSQILAAVVSKISSRTRLALLDHVTSQTGLVFPLAELIQEFNQRGIETLIDGAHVPGMLPLNLRKLNATYYTGNCHKWLCSPKGAAFLYVRRDRQPNIRPLTISHGANADRPNRSRFHLEFDWMGTDDPTAYLCVPTAIQFMDSLLPGGWAEMMATNRALAIAARETLCDALDISPPCPNELLGSLAVVPLPDGNWQTLHDALLKKYQIEVPIIPWGHPLGRQIRISAQIYNHPAQYEYLAKALVELLR